MRAAARLKCLSNSSGAQIMFLRRLAMVLSTTVAIAATSNDAHAQGVIVIDNAVLEVQPVQVAGRVAACGFRIKAPHAMGVQAVRTWDVTLHLPDAGKDAGMAVNASSYDAPADGGPAMMRPAPTELAFSVKGNAQVFTATGIRPSKPEGASLALLKDRGAGQILAAFETGTPAVVFFHPKNSATEAVIISGKQDPHSDVSLGQCIQAMRHL